MDISDPFRALSDPTRREIIRLLASGALPVRMIAGHFPAISRPAVSKHLRILREGRLVSERRSGRDRYYRLELETLETTLGWIASVNAEAGGGEPARGIRAKRARGARGAGPRRAKKSKVESTPVASGKTEPPTPRLAAKPARSTAKSRVRKPTPAKPAPASTESDDWKAW